MEYYRFVLILLFHNSKALSPKQSDVETANNVIQTQLRTADIDILNNINEREFIPKNYLNSIKPPTSNGEPIQIGFSMQVFVISAINQAQMDFRIDMYIKQEWEDTRLIVPDVFYESGQDYINLPSAVFKKIWLPDIYFVNSKTEEHSLNQFSSVMLYNNKTIRYTTRKYAILACQMEFSNFPMDTQICPITIQSFAYNNKLIKLKWIGQGASIMEETKHIQFHILPLHLKETNYYDAEVDGNFSQLIVYFAFERQIGHHLIQFYAPSTLIVGLSWFSFWLSFDAIPGRVTLLVTCQLSLVTMFSDLRDVAPAVDYVKAMDIWMAGCMILVFGAVGEFVVAKVIFSKYNEVQERGLKTCIVHILEADWDKELWKKLDRASRAIFPLVFFVFIVTYWTILIYRRKLFKQIEELLV